MKKQNSTGVKEVKPEEVRLTPKDVETVKEAIKQAQLDTTKLTPESQEVLEKMMKEADMPIHLGDKDITLGKQELDVRALSTKNWRQMEFRQLILQNVYLKQLLMTMTDNLRLLMVIADKLGVTDIVGATDTVLEKVEKVEKEKAEKATNDIKVEKA